jgi:hypothetical protein
MNARRLDRFFFQAHSAFMIVLTAAAARLPTDCKQ